jgi:hypothetical protein
VTARRLDSNQPKGQLGCQQASVKQKEPASDNAPVDAVTEATFPPQE